MLDQLKLRWRALFRKDELDQELDAELRFHLEREAEQNARHGMDANDARYSALKSFGALERAKEECRDARGVRLVHEFLQDLRYGRR
jgi:putative ABC transport system permease protein